VAGVAKDTSLEIDGIILITPWDTFSNLVKSHFPFFVAKYFLKDKYDSVDNLKYFQGNIAVVGAGRDEIIPIRHAINLYESLPGKKKMWTIQEAHHNDWSAYVDILMWKEIMGFVH
jgi:fermentation-respiration switch protein FrsA (DUF1100 family)